MILIPIYVHSRTFCYNTSLEMTESFLALLTDKEIEQTKRIMLVIRDYLKLLHEKYDKEVKK